MLTPTSAPKMDPNRMARIKAHIAIAQSIPIGEDGPRLSDALAVDALALIAEVERLQKEKKS